MVFSWYSDVLVLYSCCDITEILLKVVLNTHPPNPLILKSLLFIGYQYSKTHKHIFGNWYPWRKILNIY